MTKESTNKTPGELEPQGDQSVAIALWRGRISLFFAAIIPLVLILGFLRDLLDNGKIDNSLVVLGLFIFGGALSGQAVEKIVNRFFG